MDLRVCDPVWLGLDVCCTDLKSSHAAQSRASLKLSLGAVSVKKAPVTRLIPIG